MWAFHSGCRSWCARLKCASKVSITPASVVNTPVSPSVVSPAGLRGFVTASVVVSGHLWWLMPRRRPGRARWPSGRDLLRRR
jgi:hypothetical protein